MTKSALILTLGLLALLMAGCAPDPRRQADADATRMEAEQLAANQEQVRKQDAEEHEIKTNFVKTAAPFINAAIKSALIAVMFAAFVTISSFGVGMSVITISAGFSTARRNYAKPIQIRLDPVTRQYPLLMNKVSEGKFSLTNPNTGSVTLLYERNPNDKLLIQAMSAVQYIGAMGHEARLSHKPEALTSVERLPEIIDMESKQ